MNDPERDGDRAFNRSTVQAPQLSDRKITAAARLEAAQRYLTAGGLEPNPENKSGILAAIRLIDSAIHDIEAAA